MSEPDAERPAVRVRIVHLSADQLAMLAEADLDGASRSLDLRLATYLVGDERIGVWRRRVRQVAQTPDDLPWVTGLIQDVDSGEAVGAGGFHGAPDSDGMVEVGYGIDPRRRRRGYARAALTTMLARARADPGVHVLRATVSPTNLASLGLLRSLPRADGGPFAEVGEQWDDDDGLELVFEVSV